MAFPVVDTGDENSAEAVTGPLVEQGAADIVAFRRDCVRQDFDVPRSELPFDGIEAAAETQFRPGWAESRLLADELGVPTGEVIAYSGYSDFADLMRQDYTGEMGCTALAVPSVANTPDQLLAQTWDYKKFYEDHSVIVVRRPADGYASASVTTALGHAYMGVNAAGVAVLINNLQGTTAQVGLPFSLVVQKLLCDAGSAREAVDLLRGTPIMSTHNYLVGDEQAAFNVEAGADSVVATELDRRRLPWVHTNHTVHEELADSVTEYSDSSRPRREESLQRLRGLDADERFDVRAFLSDHEIPLCRHGDEPTATATIGAVWVTQAPVTLHAVNGRPCAVTEKQEVVVA